MNNEDILKYLDEYKKFMSENKIGTNKINIFEYIGLRRIEK